jgi:acylphosphatase
LNIKGWVKNSKDGSVVGTIQGLEEPIDTMYSKHLIIVSFDSINFNCFVKQEELVVNYW